MDERIETYDLSDIATAARLHGWEARKSGYVVKSLGKALEEGAFIPPVSLVQDPSGSLLLDPDRYDQKGNKSGGHHRALAHLHYARPLTALVRDVDYPIEDHLIFDERAGPINLADVTLSWDSFARKQYDVRIERFADYVALSQEELDEHTL